MSDILIATQSFTTRYEGRQVNVRRGVTRVRDGHPLASTHPGAFRPIGVHFDIEQATAAPGERRESAPPQLGYPRHVGAGWFEAPDGTRHRGREAAEAYMRDAG